MGLMCVVVAVVGFAVVFVDYLRLRLILNDPHLYCHVCGKGFKLWDTPWVGYDGSLEHYGCSLDAKIDREEM